MKRPFAVSHWPVLVALLLSSSAFAQSKGRTDGPEGSEIGKGGYPHSPSGRLSLAGDWGAALFLSNMGSGIPMYFGGTVSYWAADWFVLDGYGGYSAASSSASVLLGPRFRTPTWPVGGSLGLRAGANFSSIGPRFALSPIAALDMIFIRRILLGLQGSLDIPIGGPGPEMRIGINAGYRF